ncbi:hypothetical protein P5P86_08895 [Nocardioides sp. BP30]|uniref:hypothetical protein n=1 Tax=Nocardioides sp. BP30 TaxID=3036374 RepID=UPI00246844DB|nr:hypothetical protein [Nocardioides sp. BP30]WGL53930.1 hypothetical protein P5P86_08895 [Nocardioides sp. BP30]
MPRKRNPERVLAVLLRRAVLEHATAERRRRHVPILHVGSPGRPHELFAIVPGEVMDHALRTDIVAAMRRQDGRRAAGSPPDERDSVLIWLTRSGDLDLQDVDVTWHAAARQACAEAGVELCFAVVNRRGWHLPASGVRREWSRPRTLA